MQLLSMDTSSRNFSLAVSRGKKILRYRNFKLHSVLSNSILPHIEKILKSVGLSLRELDGFAVGLGPGSFTSLRAGVSTIKGLAFATGKPVVGISSLDILAKSVKQANRRICAISDARRQLVYACFYQEKEGRLKKEGKHLLTSIEDVLAQMTGETFFIGDGVAMVKVAIGKTKNCEAQYAPEKSWYPNARYLIPLALEKFMAGKYSDVEKLKPLYLYPDDCQVRR